MIQSTVCHLANCISNFLLHDLKFVLIQHTTKQLCNKLVYLLYLIYECLVYYGYVHRLSWCLYVYNHKLHPPCMTLLFLCDGFANEVHEMFKYFTKIKWIQIVAMTNYEWHEVLSFVMYHSSPHNVSILLSLFLVCSIDSHCYSIFVCVPTKKLAI